MHLSCDLFDLMLTFLPCSRSIVLVGFLAVFYFGIFTLSLMFLDPVDNDAKNEKFDESVGFDVGVLIRESNANSVRYKGCGIALPSSYLKGKDSDRVRLNKKVKFAE